MDRYEKDALQVGERVVLVKYTDSAVGEITERVDADYVQVKWRESLTTTHRVRTLRREERGRERCP